MYVFTDEWLGKLRDRYERLPLYARPMIYHIACESRYEYLRSEIEDYLTTIPAESHANLIARLRSQDHFFQTHGELAIGSILARKAQLRVEYERVYQTDVGDLTPDWTVSNISGEPLCVVEFLTDNPPNCVVMEDRAQRYLYSRLQEIEMGAVVSVDLCDACTPDQQTAVSLIKQVEQWLMTAPEPSDTIEVAGVKFELQEWNVRFSHLQFVTVSRAFWVDPSRLRNKIAEKADKYKQIAELGIPLVIAVQSEFRTGRDLDDLRSVLFDENGLFVDTDYLSGAMWLYRDLENGMGIHLIRNPNAGLKLPDGLANLEDYNYANDLRLLGKGIVLQDSAAISEYDDGMEFFRQQLVGLHMTLCMIDEISNFPFTLLGVVRPVFFTRAVRSFFDAALLAIHKLANTQLDGTYTLPQFRDRVIELMKLEYRSALTEQLQGAEFSASAKEALETISTVVNNRIVRNMPIAEAGQLLSNTPLKLTDLMEIKDAITRLYVALGFTNDEYMWLDIDYIPDSQDRPYVESPADLRRVLGLIAKNSPILSAPEVDPLMWKRYQERLSTEEIDVFNLWRRRCGLPEV